jgi:uncharacterized protein (DUF362 family)
MAADMGTDSGVMQRAYVARAGGNLADTLGKGLAFINWDRHVNKNSTVFIKPNLTFPCYKEGITTTPQLLQALLGILRGRAGRIIVGESDGGNNSFSADESFRGHDLYRICKDNSAELVNLSTLPSTVIRDKVCGKTVEVELPKLLLEEVDCFISMPVLKVHVMTTVTLSLKNSWGCVPDTMRCLRHQGLDYKLALIAKHLKPKIIIVDGIYALDNHGPMYGTAIRTDLLLIADNTVAADALGARLMGFDPQRIKHISIAARSGLGSLVLKDTEVNEGWQQHVNTFTVKRTLIDTASRLLFYSDALARLVMKSPLTPLIYLVARLLRSRQEREVAAQLGQKDNLGLY